MIKVHRAVVERLGPGPVHGVLLDTPFGFQTNAPDIAARAVDLLPRQRRRHPGGGRTPLGRRPGAAPRRRHHRPPGRRPFRLLRTGQPHLRAPPVARHPRPRRPGREAGPRRSRHLRLGRRPGPGRRRRPRLRGLQGGRGGPLDRGPRPPRPPGPATSPSIPHYDNAEGGTHDTRFSYLGEERLAQLEHELPDGVFVLGVDEHTALCLDLDAGTALVAGLGGVTVRARGRSTVLESGQTVSIDHLAEMADDLAHGRRRASGRSDAESGLVGAPSRRTSPPRAEATTGRRPAGHRSSKPSGPTRPASGPHATPVTRRP